MSTEAGPRIARRIGPRNGSGAGSVPRPRSDEVLRGSAIAAAFRRDSTGGSEA